MTFAKNPGGERADEPAWPWSHRQTFLERLGAQGYAPFTLHEYRKIAAGFARQSTNALFSSEIDSDGKIAYSRSVQRISGTTNEGKPFDTTFRITDVYRKSHSKWVIVQEHISGPPHAPRW
jgi:ketosteroid isomerase-like protein